jgi:hypothetical protein
LHPRFCASGNEDRLLQRGLAGKGGSWRELSGGFADELLPRGCSPSSLIGIIC